MVRGKGACAAAGGARVGGGDACGCESRDAGEGRARGPVMDRPVR